MAEPIIYVDKSDIHEGKVEDIKAAAKELAGFIDANVPRAIAYGIYVDPATWRMTVVQVHPDSASLEHHMKVGAPAFAKFKDMLQLVSIEVYGEASEQLRKQLSDKARMLGNGTVAVHRREAGFARLPRADADKTA